MLSAATEFKKSGFTDAESLQLAEVSARFQNIADTELSAAEASKFLISQMKAFNITASDSERIIDATNQVANEYAVGTNDLQSALTKTSSSLSTMGNTFEQILGLTTSASEIMVNQSGKVARGLRSVGINISKLATTTGELVTGYDNVTIALLDSNGAMKSTYEVMSELYPTWQKMNDTQKTSLAQTIAGKTQFDVFTASMNNFQVAVDATDTALNSSGSAMIENARYMDSIEGRLSQLRSSWELLSQKTIKSDWIKSLLSAGTSVLKFTTQIGGLQTVLVGLISTVSIIKGIKGMGGLKDTLSAISIAWGNARTGAQSFSSSLTALSSTASVAQLAIGGITAALTIGMAIWNSYKQKQEEARQKALDTANAYIETKDSLQDVISTLNSAKDIDAISKALDSVKEGLSGELEGIQDINEARQESIRLVQAYNLEQAQSALLAMESQKTEAEATLTKQYRAGQLSESDYLFSAITGTPEQLASHFKGVVETYSKLDSLTAEQTKRQAYATEQWLKYQGIVDDANQVLDTYNSINEKVIELDEQSTDAQYQYGESFKSASERVEYIKGVISDLASAQKEWNDEGSISPSILSDLEEAGYGLNDLLVIQDGKLVFNTGLLSDMNLELDDAKNNLYDVAEAAVNSASGIDTAAQQYPKVGEGLQTISGAAKDASGALSEGIDTSGIDTAAADIDEDATRAGDAIVGYSGTLVTEASSQSSIYSTMSIAASNWASSVESAVSRANTAASSYVPPSSNVGVRRGENGIPCFANGTPSFNNAVIDEHNKPEIVARNLGGRAVHLERGDAVIPNPTSINLMRFGADPAGFLSNMRNNVPQYATSAVSSGAGNIVEIGNFNVALPSVTDGDSFVKEINRTFSSLAKQYGSSRK